MDRAAHKAEVYPGDGDDQWIVEVVDAEADDACWTLFNGIDAEARAREYAIAKYDEVEFPPPASRDEPAPDPLPENVVELNGVRWQRDRMRLAVELQAAVLALLEHTNCAALQLELEDGTIVAVGSRDDADELFRKDVSQATPSNDVD
jgi:hypothetical protein